MLEHHLHWFNVLHLKLPEVKPLTWTSEHTGAGTLPSELNELAIFLPAALLDRNGSAELVYSCDHGFCCPKPLGSSFKWLHRGFSYSLKPKGKALRPSGLLACLEICGVRNANVCCLRPLECPHWGSLSCLWMAWDWEEEPLLRSSGHSSLQIPRALGLPSHSSSALNSSCGHHLRWPGNLLSH